MDCKNNFSDIAIPISCFDIQKQSTQCKKGKNYKVNAHCKTTSLTYYLILKKCN